MTHHAHGSFSVKMSPQPMEEQAAGSTLGRMALDKHYEGDLVATGTGEMLAAGTAVKGSAGYVALELVAGTLHGKRGSFVLQHSGTLNRGAPTLLVSVVPDSGTGELAGLAGTLAITIAAGAHSYDLHYTLG